MTGHFVEAGKHIDVQSMATTTKPTGCSQCDVRYMRLGPAHYADWLVQWHPGPNETNVWLTCDTQLVHVLNGVHATWAPGSMNAFLAYVRLEPPAPIAHPSFSIGMRSGQLLRAVEALREQLQGEPVLTAHAEAMHQHVLMFVAELSAKSRSPVPP